MNPFIILSIVARVITLIMLLAYVVPRQIHEVRRVKDQFSSLRWYVLAWIIFFIVTSSPAVLYQSTILNAPQNGLQNLTIIANAVSNIAIGIVLVLIYNYKYED